MAEAIEGAQIEESEGLLNKKPVSLTKGSPANGTRVLLAEANNARFRSLGLANLARLISTGDAVICIACGVLVLDGRATLAMILLAMVRNVNDGGMTRLIVLVAATTLITT